MRHLAHLLVYTLAVLGTAHVVPGIQVRSFWSAVLFALILAVLDRGLHGLLVFFSFPLIIVSFGLFLLVINGFLFWLADKITPGVHVSGFGSAMLGAFITAVFSTVLEWFLPARLS